MSGKMESVDTYKDLCGEISITHERIRDLERELAHWRKLMFANAPKGAGSVDYQQERVTSSRHVPTLDEIMPRMNKVIDLLGAQYEILDSKEKTKRKIEETLNEFEGLEYKVAYMKSQGKSLKVIAIELGYSYDYMKKVSARVKDGTKNALTTCK